MISRKILIPTLLMLLAAGLIATAADHHWWKSATPRIAAADLPLASAEYARIMAHYTSSDSAMDLGGTIRIYDGQSSLLKEARSFRCFRQGDRYFWQLSYMETYCDGKTIVQLDTLHHLMTVSKASQVGAGRIPREMPAAMLFSDTATFHITGSVEPMGKERELILHNDFQPEIKECRFFYDTATYRLSRAEMEFWKGRGRPGERATQNIWLAKVDYEYKQHSNPDIARTLAAIVRIDGSLVQGVGEYAGYQVNVNF